MDLLVLLNYILEQESPRQTIDEFYERYGIKLEQEISRYQLYSSVAKAAKDRINLSELQHITPSCELELLPKEILFMNYIAGKPINFDIPGYFVFEYNVDFQQALRKYFLSGYICFGDYITAVNNLKGEALKSLLLEYGLSKSGRLKDLRKRILDNIPTKDLKVRFDKTVFMLTVSGERCLQENSHIIYFHKNKLDISIYDADKYKKKHPNASNKDIAISLLDAKVKKLPKDNYGLYRNILYNKSKVFKSNNETHNELYYLFCVCFVDYIDYRVGGKKDMSFSPYAPAIIDRIKKIVEKSTISVSCLRALFSSSIQLLDIAYNTSDIDLAFDKIVYEIEK